LEPAWGRARLLRAAGNMAYAQCDYTRAATLYEEGLALEREIGNERNFPGLINNLAAIADIQGDYERAKPLYEESLALFRKFGDTSGVATSLSGLGNVRWTPSSRHKSRVG
jgi:tetratricopeptide (TPR) repeat protein